MTRTLNGQPWLDSGWYYKPSTPTKVMTAVARLGAHGSNYRFAWRGLANCNFTITSSLDRQLTREGLQVDEPAVRTREERILDEARRWGLGVEGGALVDDLQLLADLQHFGVSTRLIDVTSNPMTALWFATAEVREQRMEPEPGTARYSNTGLLVAISMPWYNERNADIPKTVFHTVYAPPKTWGDLRGLSAKREDGLALETPFVVSSSMPNPRLRAQDGYFIASGYPDRPTDPMPSLKTDIPAGDPTMVEGLLTRERSRGFPSIVPFVAIFIDSSFKKRLRQYLKLTYNRTEKALFPDYEGFKEHGPWRNL